MKLINVILATTLVVLVYVTATALPVDFPIAFGLLLLAQFMLGWMVLRILRDKRPSQKTFDSHFYEDGPPRS